MQSGGFEFCLMLVFGWSQNLTAQKLSLYISLYSKEVTIHV